MDLILQEVKQKQHPFQLAEEVPLKEKSKSIETYV